MHSWQSECNYVFGGSIQVKPCFWALSRKHKDPYFTQTPYLFVDCNIISSLGLPTLPAPLWVCSIHILHPFTWIAHSDSIATVTGGLISPKIHRIWEQVLGRGRVESLLRACICQRIPGPSGRKEGLVQSGKRAQPCRLWIPTGLPGLRSSLVDFFHFRNIPGMSPLSLQHNEITVG